MEKRCLVWTNHRVKNIFEYLFGQKPIVGTMGNKNDSMSWAITKKWVVVRKSKDVLESTNLNPFLSINCVTIWKSTHVKHSNNKFIKPILRWFLLRLLFLLPLLMKDTLPIYKDMDSKQKTIIIETCSVCSSYFFLRCLYSSYSGPNVHHHHKLLKIFFYLLGFYSVEVVDF